MGECERKKGGGKGKDLGASVTKNRTKKRGRNQPSGGSEGQKNEKDNRNEGPKGL